MTFLGFVRSILGFCLDIYVLACGGDDGTAETGLLTRQHIGEDKILK